MEANKILAADILVFYSRIKIKITELMILEKAITEGSVWHREESSYRIQPITFKIEEQ